MKALLYSLLVAATLTSCSKADEAVNIQSLNQEFIGAWNSKDSGKINGFLADDVSFVQGSAHWKGKGEVSQKWVNETLPTIGNLKTSVVSSSTDANTAYEAGTFAVDVLPEAPGEPRGYGEGNYIFLWKKSDDKTWKLSYAQLEDLPVQRR
ncbi:YybH family protein [Hymenobacter arizonensis]|uniref:Ketosteroid isomerase homolog n=1 Tax=Hymenobacter arizonensis TaxID=1227077 RepID=A0A1I5V7A0_HYMAR|nr:nuclear transport factor 2 family protein [Hymenobacter arizonensis]SFQ03404.1 Ketosteroid isomerase homolog [Hymenobacter arizonensis]